jgi:hypothetical protein
MSGVPGPDLYENGKLRTNFPTIFQILGKRDKKTAS